MNQNKSRAKQGMLKGKEKTQFEETKHGSEPDTDVTQILGLSDKELNIRLWSKYIMRNAGLEEAEAGIKIVGRNVNNLRCADDTTLMAESEEGLNSLLMKVKEESEKLA